MRLHFAAGLVFLAAVVTLNAECGASGAQISLNTSAVPGTVKNSPFSAEVITQYDRTLPNGNHIHRETHGKVFRDSQGRVRTETDFTAVAGGEDFRNITIQDPLQREVIHLDPKTKVATIRHLGEPAPAAATSKDSSPPAHAGNFVLTTPSGPGQATAIPLQRPESANQSSVRTEALGTKLIESLSATGTRTTRVIENGSGEPTISINDSWYSRDLQMVILTDSDDGQSGHSVMQVKNIVRIEPSAQLFQVPSDYTIKDGSPATASVKH